jgi:hypothetical protein
MTPFLIVAAVKTSNLADVVDVHSVTEPLRMFLVPVSSPLLVRLSLFFLPFIPEAGIEVP